MAHGFRRPRRSSTSPSRRSTVRCAVTASDRPTRRLLRPAQRWHELGPPSARREIVRAIGSCRNSKEALMAIVAGFDVHRAQITFDALDTDTGEVMRGRIDATPAAVARWAARFAGRRIEVAVEACRPSSPDHADSLALKARGLSHPRASLTIARKLARRSYHVLRQLGPTALEPVATA